MKLHPVIPRTRTDVETLEGVGVGQGWLCEGCGALLATTTPEEPHAGRACYDRPGSFHWAAAAVRGALTRGFVPLPANSFRWFGRGAAFVPTARACGEPVRAIETQWWLPVEELEDRIAGEPEWAYHWIRDLLAVQRAVAAGEPWWLAVMRRGPGFVVPRPALLPEWLKADYHSPIPFNLLRQDPAPVVAGQPAFRGPLRRIVDLPPGRAAGLVEMRLECGHRVAIYGRCRGSHVRCRRCAPAQWRAFHAGTWQDDPSPSASPPSLPLP